MFLTVVSEVLRLPINSFWPSVTSSAILRVRLSVTLMK